MRKGSKLTQEHKKKISLAHKGKKKNYDSWLKGVKGLQSWHNISGLKIRKKGCKIPKYLMEKLWIGRRKTKMPKGKNHYHWQGGKPKCKDCGKELTNYGVNYCMQCIGKYKSGKNNYNWLGGISREPYGFDFDNELKKLIRKRDNYKCQLCGAPQEEFIQPLPIHHIDYDKQNSDPKNLIVLCSSCHCKTNFNREYWIKYFQEKMEEKNVEKII